ncbi:killer toxin resistant protein [Coemansia aciculifera]|uniref:Killer toxin resistant protein n=1 Tax=Coemansia aciculifera TaxID=417176 RepID=A0A9W8II81_9FUNG|nr:killer toxin resistant protein [Coemansia aciculifera]KAJ2872435.1 killer toxin resistant protein [Coemansia aciculifera]
MRVSLHFLSSLAATTALYALASSRSSAAGQSSPIRTRLLASFAAPPLVLEIAEGIAAHNSSGFFPFILKLAQNRDIFEQTDAQAYSQTLEWIAQDSLLEPFALSLLKLELAAHIYAPAVVAQYQLYNSTVVPEIKSVRQFDDSCAAWAQYKDKQACSVEAVDKLLDIEKFYGTTYIEQAKIEPMVLSLDHVYAPKAVASAAASKLVVLYADPRAEGFIELHEHLVAQAENDGITYVLRYRPWISDNPTSKDHSLGLSGYGVELALKSTEYKVIDDRDLDLDRGHSRSGSKRPKLVVQDSNSGDDALLFEAEKEPVIKGLSEKLIAKLGIQATQMILQADDKLAVLKQLAQDLPRYAHLLSEVAVNSTVANDVRAFAELEVRPLFAINGVSIDSDDLDPFKLLEHIRKENEIIGHLEAAGLTQSQAIDLIIEAGSASAAGGAEGKDQLVFDMRDKSKDKKTVLWLNDLERDSRYSIWPSDVQNLLRIQRPGMIQRLRKNIVQIIFALDLSVADSWVMIFEDIVANIEHGLPMQFGVVPLIEYRAASSLSPANQMAMYTLYLRRSFKKKEWQSVIKGALLTHLKAKEGSRGKNTKPFVDHARSVYEAYIKTHQTKDNETPLTWEQIIGMEKSWLSKRWDEAIRYCSRLDLSPSSAPVGMAFVNGVQYPLVDGYQQDIFKAFQLQTWELAQKLRGGKFAATDDILDFVYGSDSALSSRNTFIYASDENPLRFASLSKPLVRRWMDDRVQYLTFGNSSSSSSDTAGKEDDVDDELVISTWVVGDFATAHARSLAASALAAAKTDPTVQVALVHVSASSSGSGGFRSDGEQDEDEPEGYEPDAPQILYQLATSAASTEAPAELAAFISRYLADGHVDEAAMEEFPVAGDNLALLTVLQSDLMDEYEQALNANNEAAAAMGIVPANLQSCNVVVNGRVLPAITPDTPFTKDTFAALADYEDHERIGPIRTALAEVAPLTKPEDVPALVMRIGAILEQGKAAAGGSVIRPSQGNKRVSVQSMVSDSKATLITVNDPATARLRIQVVLDPLSESAQKWAPILQTLATLPGASLEIWLNPQSGLKELPVKRFYRYLWPSELEFSSAGNVRAPEVVFNGVPADPLLTLGMDVPSAWLVTAVESIHDLDNIRLSSLRDREAGISAIYRLVNILVEGHLVDTNSRSPARGLEVRIGTLTDMAKAETIVMANLGYLQLKANPGVWKFSIRPGRSAEIYKLDNIGSGRWDYRAAKLVGADGEDTRPVLVTSFNGATVFPLVSKRLGKEGEDVLLDAAASGDAKKATGVNASGGGGGIWGKLKGTFGGNGLAASDSRPHFDVFAVASGHLYERLMSIMIMSVLNSTQSHVKFWLIENFLSPSFKAFVPHMAEEFGFDYEFVTYKWPHWLNHETEKQRTIWGYKILFLDVLFPLSLDRVIFVDADQIVRADLQELTDMDLQGAPYGYTPFCDDRAEIDGYRFWKNGWWKDHLRGKPYHISALYVVDLQRFRQLAAGDRLRGQYQALSRDAGSLANLDQDLPNNMQHIVPIHSLPQEWLWCETWCSDASLKRAKTIDLCNNPMTKEPKLERARRLLPEWDIFDKQIANFTRVLAQRGKHEGVQIADAEAVNIDQTSVANKHDEL